MHAQSDTISAPNTQWRENYFSKFTVADKESTTVLVSGLPNTTLNILKSIFSTSGINVHVMDEADNAALQLGREFGNRGQCNPTYFLVGNLIKHLNLLHKESGLSKKEISEKYLFATAGGCGPCRMGMYITEYRKALRDSGYEGFRVLIFSRSGDVEDILSSGLKFSSFGILKFFTGIHLSDLLIKKRLGTRPYFPDNQKEECEEYFKMIRMHLEDALSGKKSIILAFLKIRTLIAQIPSKYSLDFSQRKIRVKIMGEFWAKTTEGEGNYNLFKFLEEEGGIVQNESITDWLLHQVWRAKWIAKRKNTHTRWAEVFLFNLKEVWPLSIAEFYIYFTNKLFALMLNIPPLALSNHQELAELVKNDFDLHIDGGEDHMEVAHFISAAKTNSTDLVISVKPFTCLSSSAVSDGVMAKVSGEYPHIECVSVETNGDSAANFYSRVQMAVQKVKLKKVANN